jgi:hypothetical protein
MTQVTVEDLREYMLENNPHFEEGDNIEDQHSDWFSEAIDTKFGEIDGLGLRELARQWTEEASDEYVTKSAFVADLFSEHISSDVIEMMSEEEKDLFIHIHVDSIQEIIDRDDY